MPDNKKKDIQECLQSIDDSLVLIADNMAKVVHNMELLATKKADHLAKK